MRTILIAEDSERKLVEEYLPGETNILVTGVGALNIIRSLHDLPRDTELINIGYAGSANYAIGTVVEVTESRLHHPNVTYPEPRLTLQPVEDLFFRALNPTRAVCYSNTDFVLASPYKDCVFDMELAYICAQGFTHVSAIKVVSDNLSLHAYREVANGVEAADQPR
jgi:hypothetical protein